MDKTSDTATNSQKVKENLTSGQTTPVKLLYDTWDADGNRVAAGQVVELPLEAAKQLLRDGKAERADPLPGETTA